MNIIIYCDDAQAHFIIIILYIQRYNDSVSLCDASIGKLCIHVFCKCKI